MKKIIGIVSEYNPFHEGHQFHIEESRKIVEDNDQSLVICCMSGDFVQRGEWAILPKHERAVMAIRGGADLVVELPLPWCLSSAEGFAEGAVSILTRMGITHLSFGSECGDIGLLTEAARQITAPGFQEKVSEILKKHPELSYPAARGLALDNLDNLDNKLYNGFKTLLESPNNLLGVEYLKALIKSNALRETADNGTLSVLPENLNYATNLEEPYNKHTVTPVTVKRLGSRHDGPCSAMEIRRTMREKGKGPDNEVLELAAISRLRAYKKDYFLTISDTENGAGGRIFEAVQSGACTIDEICDAAKTKSLTHARLRRIVMRAVMGITKEMTENRCPPYARILAANEKGRAYLADNRKDSTIPIVILNRDARELDAFSQKVYFCGVQARDFYNLGIPEKRSMRCGEDCRIHPFML